MTLDQADPLGFVTHIDAFGLTKHELRRSQRFAVVGKQDFA